MKSHADQFPLRHKGTLTSPYESLFIGNGDLAASAQVFSQELRLTMGKNDVWDSRLNTITEDVVLKHDDLIRYSREYGFEADRPAVDSIYYDWPGRPPDLKICNFGLQVPGVTGTSKVGPSPKIVGTVRVIHPGLSGTKVESEVDISQGILTVKYQFPNGVLLIESFVHRDTNNVLMRLSAQGSIPWLSILLEKTPDSTDPEMPLPVVEKGEDPFQWSISQTIPGKFDVPDFSWHVVGAFGEKVMPKDEHPGTTHIAAEDYVVSEVKEWACSLQQDIRLIDGESVVLSVGVATDRDGTGDRRARAFEVAIAASEALQVDERRRGRWKEHLGRVPEIPYGWKNGQGWYALAKDWEKIWPDFEDYLYHARYSRWGCGAWIVFPGEHLDGDEEGGLAAALRDLIDRIDLDELPKKMTVLGTFHGEATVTPYIRLGLMNHYDKIRGLILNHRFASGLFSPYSTGTGEFVRTAYIAEWRINENQYMPLLGVTEMLLQSQGGVLRLFPFLPREKAASFSGLRARGGFIVSARLRPGEGLEATIESINGNPCRIRWREDTIPTVSKNNRPIEVRREGNDILFDTEAGASYELHQM
jgi:hypothetical protein